MDHHQKPKPPRNLSGYLEAMTRIVFQAGMSWRVVEAKWDGFKAAFHEFDPARVAALTGRDIDRLGRDQRIIRNVPKIAATVENARTLITLDKARGGFRGYLRSLDGFDDTTAALHKQFRFLGVSGTYFFLWSVGEKVPSWEQWHSSRERKPSSATVKADKPPVRKAPAAKATARTSRATAARQR